MVDLWRPWVEDRAGRTLAKLDKVAEDQETFGRQLRDLLKVLASPMSSPKASARRARTTSRIPRAAIQNSEETSEGQDSQDQASDDQRGEGEEGRPPRPPRTPTRTSSMPTRRRGNGRRARALAAQLQRSR